MPIEPGSTIRAAYRRLTGMRRRAFRAAPTRLRSWLRPRRLVGLTVAAVLLSTALVAASAIWIRSVASGKVYTVRTVPEIGTALVLGAEVRPDGSPSPVLRDRLERARQLYASGRVRAILVSGDNGQVEYNEVDPMRGWLVDHGVPAHRVVGDYAGFDTYSSCVRAIRVFGVTSAIVVTQPFHLTRAIALCRTVGIDAVGVPATNAGLDRLTLAKLTARDKLAGVKAAGDMLVRPDPKYLGRHETGVEQALASY